MLRILLVATPLVVILLAGCSEQTKALADIRAAFSNENYEETVILCEHALRQDIRDSDVYYYYGLSLLELGRDYEAFRRFDEAVVADSTKGVKIAAWLIAKGQEAFSRGEARRAAERVKIAANLDSQADLGSFKYLVADAYFGEKRFETAADLYRSAIEERPDTSVAEGAYFNLAQCYVVLGDSTNAVNALEQLLDRFPKGSLSGRARWKLVNLLYEHARTEFTRGNYQTVVKEIKTLLTRTSNNSLVQRARFLLGEAYERMADYPRAYEQYKTIIDKDRGASGRIVERARQKIEALRESGLL